MICSATTRTGASSVSLEPEYTATDLRDHKTTSRFNKIVLPNARSTTKEKNMIRAILIGLSLFALTACETAKGAGKDIEKAGDAIQNAASDVQEKL